MNIYGSLYELLSTYLFGGAPAVGSYQELVCILFSSLTCILTVAIPFLVVFSLVRSLFFRWR